MAKLLSYYRLCPLIDTKNLLGISEDAEKGSVIVTLGRNMAIKFRLSDQKQKCSWRSKEKFCSPVMYDRKLEKYVAVFNHSFIRIWTNEDESLDKVKKYKFNTPIHTILIHNGEAFVVFKTGSLYALSEILDTRKTFTPAVSVNESEILDIVYTSLDEDLYFGVILKCDEGFKLHWTVHTYYSRNIFSEISLPIQESSLKGYMLFASNKQVNLLTVWSDGKIYAKSLIHQDKKQQNIGELFTVVENISTQHFIRILPLDDRYVAIYGSDPNEEGAILLIYNTQFKVTQSKQVHKLYSDEAKIWRAYNFIFLPVGQNLFVVPFCLESEQLVTLIGSHRPEQTKVDSDIAFVTEFQVADWDVEENVSKKKKKVKSNFDQKNILSSHLQKRISDLFEEGLPESMIIEQIIPEIFEENNVDLLKDCIKFFVDIPEKHMARILKFILSCDRKHFSTSDTSYSDLPPGLLPNERVIILDQVLKLHFSENLLLPHLRQELSVDEARLLLQYLVYQLSEDGHKLPHSSSIGTERCIIKWANLLIDSNYQKFVLSRDDMINNVLVKCRDTVDEHLDILEDLMTIVPILTRLEAEMDGKSYASNGLANDLYSIEQITY